MGRALELYLQLWRTKPTKVYSYNNCSFLQRFPAIGVTPKPITPAWFGIPLIPEAFHPPAPVMMLTDQMASQQWLGNFNPDGAINPHDVDQSGAGRFREVGRFNPNASSLQGGIFAEEQNHMPRGNMAAVQRVKARNSTDFRERLALAEARDGQTATLYSGNDDLVHYAGARPQPKKQLSPRSRRNAILNKQQSVMDKTAEEQRQRQYKNVAKNGYLAHYRDEDDGMGKAAGGKSKTLVMQQKLYEQQQQVFGRATQQQDRRTQIQRQQQQMQMQQEQHQRMWGAAAGGRPCLGAADAPDAHAGGAAQGRGCPVRARSAPGPAGAAVQDGLGRQPSQADGLIGHQVRMRAL